MKCAFLICALLIWKLNLHAQQIDKLHFIEGTLTALPAGEPLKSASASLLDETSQQLVKFTLSNDSGYFKFKELEAGTYLLKISYKGYRDTVIAHLKLAEPVQHINLGNIGLTLSASSLETVTVTAAKPVIENKIDRIVYNAANEVTAGDASDLLRKVPMVTVDMDGNPSLRGNRNVQVLIDGKPTGAGSGNIGDILQAIPVNQVKSIEVITSPSAKYDADGSAGIINIITRKKVLEGITGSASGAIGTRQLIGNASITGKIRRLTFDLNGGISNKWPRDIGINAYNYYASGDTSRATGNTINARYSNNSFMTLQYEPNEKNLFSSTFHSSSLGFDDKMKQQLENKFASGAYQHYAQTLNGKFESGGFDWNADYLHRFKKKGEELDIAGQWSQNTSKQNYTSLYSAYLPGQQAYNHGKNNEYTLQIDYTLPVNKTVTIDAGAKTVYRSIESSYTYLNIDSTGKSNFDSLSSNIYNYKQQLWAAYLVLDWKLKNNWNIQIGNRFEATYINGQGENAQVNLKKFSNNYNTYVPGLKIMKKFQDNSSLKFSYSKRIQRPSLQYLNPFQNSSDPMNYSLGKPSLAPENIQTFEASYYRGFKIADFSTSVYYRFTNNLIESITKAVPYTTTDQNGNSFTRMVAVTNYDNIGVNNSFGLNLFGSLNFIKNLNIRASLDLYTYRVTADSLYKPYLNQGTFLLYDGFAGATYQFPKNIFMEANYSFQSKRRTFQGTTYNLNIFTIGAKKTLFKGNGSIGVYAMNIFQENWHFNNNIHTPALVQYRDLATPFRSFNLKLSYKFGNMKMKAPQKRGVNNDDLK
jgi:outer membrane receptor protein involved in Fe transport